MMNSIKQFSGLKLDNNFEHMTYLKTTKLPTDMVTPPEEYFIDNVT